MGKRKPTPRTVQKRLWEETQKLYICYREFYIFGAPQILAQGKRLGKALAQIRDDPEIVNDEAFLYRATQLLEEGERKTEEVLWRTQIRMQKEGYDIRGEE